MIPKNHPNSLKPSQTPLPWRTWRTWRFVPFLLLILPQIAIAQTSPTSLQVTVNTNQDGQIQPDDKLTLREAIALVNGNLSVEKLSNQEKAQVQPSNNNARIEFNLPPNQTTIQLQQELPPLNTPGLIVDGTSQPSYDASRSATAEIAIPQPIVTITPAANQEILRGFTVVADNVQIRGLSIYGFRSLNQGATLTTPPADIFISHRLPPPNTKQQQPPNSNFPFGDKDIPPKGVVIENNWLGITPDEKMPENTSAFGVYVFNSTGTTIRRNRISYHEGSAIITSVRAENTLMTENIIVGNGIAGMPDAVRLEGVIANSQLQGNLICGNDGAGVYLFKPTGNVKIHDNRITFNGRRLRRAAVYLMGNANQVTDNEIRNQTGPGVSVTAFGTHGSFGSAIANIIQNNRFSDLEGLSIDLNTQQQLNISDFQRGDGPNPKRNSPNRRLETANGAVNAPEFASSQLLLVNGQALISGAADPGTKVQIYRVQGNEKYGPLSEPLTTLTADEKGNFSGSLAGLRSGERISAIATHPKYGTSEPAYNAIITDPSGKNNSPSSINNSTPPKCVSVPLPPQPTPQPEPEPIRLKAPRIIHFALDKDFISQESSTVLNQVAQVLQQYPFIVIEIEGHTDIRASDAYNLDLGKRRAMSARNYLLKQGIAAERMTIRSLGEKQRRTSGNTVIDTARDRRVEIIFKDTRGLEIILEEQEKDLQIEPTS
ncbi:cell envelope biogenesis protein OmpA [Nostoc piscinale CENA21]|uniref:Cell envelope biogenesis protein OmpA n=1 Tax=Nostoc piscinale CENA21 TaxID=224013 RepID=A0A0M5MHI0_9NOSO|nr:OmpA family protein [Nostoc piscinale]ALF54705.1 cell envelope biogenesis protein OmpA [Nostoc piscinale CENA21]